MADDLKRAEGRGYAKGYAAGRRRLQADIDMELAREREQRRWDAFFCAAMTGAMAQGGWKTGDKPWGGDKEYARGAANIADKMLDEARRRYG